MPEMTARQLRETATPEQMLNSRNLRIYSIYDKKAVAYTNPFYYHQKGQAIRGFEDAVNDLQSPLNKHPEDFQLFQIGEWNDTTGVITPLQNPVHVEDALNCVKNK